MFTGKFAAPLQKKFFDKLGLFAASTGDGEVLYYSNTVSGWILSFNVNTKEFTYQGSVYTVEESDRLLDLWVFDGKFIPELYTIHIRSNLNMKKYGIQLMSLENI